MRLNASIFVEALVRSGAGAPDPGVMCESAGLDLCHSETLVRRLGRRVHLIVFGLAVTLGTAAAVGERLPLKFYTTAEGLPHNEINRIVRDSRGFLWFCTADGLARFDGYTFTNFGTDQGLPHANVTDLLETRDGQYWVATSGGLARFDPGGAPGPRVAAVDNAAAPPRGTMFTIVTSDDEDPRAKSLTVLLEDKNGTIWCGTQKGLCRLLKAGGRYIAHTVDLGSSHEGDEHAFVTDILEDHDGSLWIATSGGLYRHGSDGSRERYTIRDGLPSDFLHDLLQDHLGRLWAGTRGSGLFQFKLGDSHHFVIVRSYTLQDVLPTSWVFQLLETSDHTFWVATNLGLLEFFPDADATSSRFHVYTTNQGLSYREVTALNEDASGNLWLGTNTAGLMKLARNGLVTYDRQDGVTSVNAIFEDRAGGLCFKGAFANPDSRGKDTHFLSFARFDGRRFKGFGLSARGANTGWVYEHVTLQARNGEWWVGSGSVFRFPASSNFAAIASAHPIGTYTNQEGPAYQQAFRMFEDSRGDVWVSTISGGRSSLARWEHATGKWNNLASTMGLSLLVDDLPRSFGEDRSGNVWIGFNGQLARYHHGHVAWFTAKDGMPPGAITNMHLDQAGRLWITSARSGLIRINGPDSEHPTFTGYTTVEGLSSNRTEVITEDLYGRLYVGTGRALDRLDPGTGRVKHFTSADGLAHGMFRAAFRDRTGALWFGMTGGLSKLVPVPDRNPLAPPILVSALTVAGGQRSLFPFGEHTVSLPDLGYDQNQLQVEFVGLDFGPGETLRYQYKLEGAKWSVPSEQRSISFARLAPGPYKLLVRAVNSDGATSAVPASVVFRVLPPIWQRWWFLMLVAVSIAAGAWFAYRYRMRRILEIADIRARIASDLHDDIGSNLTKIAILSEVARQQLGVQETPPGDDPLSSIARIARESVASMSDIVWAINPQRDRLLDLVRRMRLHAEQVFTTRGVKLTFRAPAEDHDMKLTAEVRRDVLLIFKEAVNNAARHAQCSQVEIDLRLEDPWLLLDVSDDGVGFDPTAVSHGQGLANMRRRAQRLGGTCEVRTGRQNSTIVHTTIAVGRTARPTLIGR